MPHDRIEDDDYIANLLKQDAKDAAKKYELVGIDAFNPKRVRSGAPKPNTNFLRHIIRQTDSHNAALLAKEAEESRARLNGIDWGTSSPRRNHVESRNRGRSKTPPLEEDVRRSKKRRRDYSDDEDARKSRKRTDDAHSRDHHPGRGRDKDRYRTKLKKRREDSDRDDDRSHRESRHTRHHDGKERRHRHHDSSEEEDRRTSRKDREGPSHRRRRSRSKSISRVPSASPRSRSDHKTSKYRHGSRSSRRRSRSPARSATNTTTNGKVKHTKRPSPSPASDSDPLEAIVGPLPPPKGPPIRSRGRGAHKIDSSTGIDARFSSNYDPTADVQVDSDVEDSFGDALEAYRDRQKWKRQGSDRLREAGFTDAQITKWEKGDEKGEEDVVWSTRGQKREWDRNKVVDEDGYTELKADFGRLT
ncbi:hypothetical protein CC80DRAFT_14502 [Byssothecium circinans]|uniref:Pre-mRNA-splicing factor 38B n=1 Tax=Byssothecium circinans TaxID=147558 RepID=A0A6A5U1Q0_9PLEO|nr:hypothetical protein CC80DRAFT_14502 [Byssothecium circinans]